MEIQFHDLGEGWVGGHALSILAAKKRFEQDVESFLLVPVDHVYDQEIISIMATPELSLPKGGGARLLIENDLEGMVGLPQGTVHVATRPLHAIDRIHQIGHNLQGYSALDAGLARVTPDIFSKLEQCQSVQPYFTMLDAFKGYCFQGKLFLMKTDGRTWFSVETETATKFTERELKASGKKLKLPDGRSMNLVGLPRQVQATPSGGNWSEFSVAKWKDTVYCASSYFTELFHDSSRFIREYAQMLGGTENVAIVEVGCGTGEALSPLYNDAKYVIGVDINPKFIEFCEQNVPQNKQHKVKHIVGDVTELCDQLHRDLPDWMADTKKVVMCVGNTIGIIPEPIKSIAYEQMAQLAGPQGVVVIVYWNGNKFGDAVQHFYNKNPALCGTFDGSCIDLNTCTLRTPSGYATHWTTPEEAKGLIADKGFKLVACEEAGKGVLVAYRIQTKSRSTSPSRA
jgi:choline kinase